jgi:hypothetical protein
MKRIKALESTAHHEAGHAVAAYQLGQPIKSVTISPDDDSSGSVSTGPYFSGDEWDQLIRVNSEDISGGMQQRLENDVLVCLAGPAAEKRFNFFGYRKGHGEQDRKIAMNWLSKLEGDNQTLGYYFRMFDLRARNFVQRATNWGLICHLAETLLVRPTLTGDEMKSVILEGFQVSIEKSRG